MYVICSVIRGAESFKNNGSRLSAPVDFLGLMVCKALHHWRRWVGM